MTLKDQAIQTALQGNWQEAISINKALVKEDPKDIEALNRLALAFTITGKIKEAKSTYQKVLSMDPLNYIAQRNLKRIKDIKETSNGNGELDFQTTQINNQFIEESGKTKVVELLNIAQQQVIEALRTGQSLTLSVKRSKIFVSHGKQYIGVLPDDIARRLIKFINSGCSYNAYVKSSSAHKIIIFIKEVKKIAKLKDLPSFTSLSESPLTLDKNTKIKSRVGTKISKENEDESQDHEEESL